MDQKYNGDVFHAALSFTEVGVDLEDKPLLQELAEIVIDYFELSIVEQYWHQYEPIGLTGVYVLEQSSLTLHTWSEFRKLVIDITTCGKRVNIDEVSETLKRRLATENVKTSKEIL